MDMQNMALVLLVVISITTGIIYGLFIAFERKTRWPAHYQPYGYPVKSGLMGSRRTSMSMFSRMPVIVASNAEVNAADFRDKW